jgi:mono/diheme cytochrome c family protein
MRPAGATAERARPRTTRRKIDPLPHPSEADTLKRTLSSSLALIGTASTLVGLAACSPGAPEYPTEPLQQQAAALQARPLSGGTLLVLQDGNLAVASDPDRDTVSIVDLAGFALAGTVKLHVHDEPGRLVEDGAGRVHVALRGGGAVVTIDVHTMAVVERRQVCSAPRGLAYEAASDALHVACAGGELITLPAKGGEAVRRLRLDRDLRDVAVDGENLLVSRFRAAEVLTVSPAGEVTERRLPGAFDAMPSGMIADPTAPRHFEPAVAWRMTPIPGGGVMVVHQRAQTTAIDLTPTPTAPENPYLQGNGCNGTIVQTTVTEFDANGSVSPPAMELSGAAVPVDLAISPDGSRVAIVAAGSNVVLEGSRSALDQSDGCKSPLVRTSFTGGPIAVAYAAGRVLVQTRYPSALLLDGHEIDLAPLAPHEALPSLDPGRELFHAPPDGSTSLACASCHPEGREDGRVWNFLPMGARRTQSLAGDVTETAPFHWGGDLVTFDDLMREVFVRRMGGVKDGLELHGDVLKSWLATIPAPPASEPLDAAAVKRGSALFHDAEVACATCHAGAKGTNDKTVDVGTGTPLQVPWLVGVAWRAPFLHDGSAATLRDRFGASGGGDKHGHTSQLSSAQLDDLVAYLETL